MQITQKLIDSLVRLEAHYHYSPSTISDDRDEAFDLLYAAGGGVHAELMLAYEDQNESLCCARIVGVLLDTYAPRASILDLPDSDTSSLDRETIKWEINL